MLSLTMETVSQAVLPVVARKKGLEGHYQQADGAPRVPKPVETVPEPVRSLPSHLTAELCHLKLVSFFATQAPGTFGFKYRVRQDSQGINTPLDNFAHDDALSRPEGAHPSELERPTGLASPPPQMRSSASPRPESPAPFSHYVNAIPAPVPQIRVTRPSTEAQKMEMQIEEEQESGCCKCVIM